MPERHPVRVGHVLPTLEVGGQEWFVAHLLRALREQGVIPMVITLTGAGPVAERLSRWEIPVVHATPRRHLPGWPAALLDTLRDHPIDVLHSHSGSWFPTAIAGRVRGIPVVHTEHGRYPDEPRWVTWADRLAARWTSALVTVSRPLADQLGRKLGGRAEPRCIPNGVPIPVPLSTERRAELRRSIGVEPDTVLVGTVGRLVEAKDHRTFLQSLAGVFQRFDRARAVIVGDGPLRSVLAEEARRSGLDGRLQLAGYRADAVDLTATFDIYVSSSATEGMPIAVLEAMAAGRPIVATDVGGLADMLADGEVGRLVAPGDPASLGDAIASLIDDPRGRADLGLRARARVETYYGMAACAGQYAALYAMVASG